MYLKVKEVRRHRGGVVSMPQRQFLKQVLMFNYLKTRHCVSYNTVDTYIWFYKMTLEGTHH